MTDKIIFWQKIKNVFLVSECKVDLKRCSGDDPEWDKIIRVQTIVRTNVRTFISKLPHRWRPSCWPGGDNGIDDII